MILRDLLAALAERGVWLWSDPEKPGELLRFRAPSGALNDELKAALREHKRDILAILSDFTDIDRDPSLPLLVHTPREPQRRVPLSDMQKAYWLGRSAHFELGGVEPHIYAEADVLNLDVERLEVVVNRIIAHNEMLRAFVDASRPGEEDCWQLLDQVPRFRIQTVDLRDLDDAKREERLQGARKRMNDVGPSCVEWPLFEILVHHLPEQRSRIQVNFHLLPFDTTTFGLLIRQAVVLYGDPEAALPKVPLCFDDLVEGYALRRKSPAYEKARRYWLDRVPKLPPPPKLPLARDPSTVETPHFVHREIDLIGEDLTNLRQRAQNNQVTVAATLCSAFCDVLAAWSENSEMLLNLLSANRIGMHPNVNDVVGNFNTTVLLDVDADPQVPFALRTARLQNKLLENREHGVMGGVEVVREINRLKRDPSRAAVPIVFNASAAPDWPEGMHLTVQTAQVYLECGAIEMPPDKLRLWWVAVEELFHPGMIEDIYESYLRRVRELAASDEAWQATGAGNLVPPRQLELQRQVNDTAWSVPDALLHQLFEKQVDVRPEAVAVVSRTTELTYSELEARSNSVASWLRERGARPNQLVGVMMDKGWEQLVAVLAILKAGAAYLPIDPSLPEQRRAFLLDQCHEGRVLTTSQQSEALPPRSAKHFFEIDQDISFRERNERLEPMQGPQDLAYVIFTSGSTGVPKGVMIENGAAANTILDINDRFSVGSADAVLALSSLGFDLSVYDVFGMLAAGGRVVIPEAKVPADPQVWLDLLVEQDITIWNSAPAFMDMLATHAGDEPRLDRLRLVLLSGDWIPVRLPDGIRQVAPNAEVVSLGGATEASIWSVFYPIDKVAPEWTSIPYGTPLRNQRVYVLDEMLRTRPFHVPGEIFLAGKGLARGYWNDAKRTSERFITHPDSGETLYKTGDMGRVLPDGNVEILGRLDFQVKVQGYRIELGEIEHALLAHPDVESAVVVAVGKRDGARRLVAYVVRSATEDVAQADEELSAFLGRTLPEYMVPSQYMVLDQLPLSPNGKVDRKALPDPRPQVASQTEATVPRNDLERSLAESWARVLELESIGITDDFFDAGGQSVTAISLLADIRAGHGVDLSLSVLVANPTIAKLAEAIDKRRASRGPELLVPIQEGDSDLPIVCFHPVGGNVACYVEFGRALGRQHRPIMAAQSAGLSGASTPTSSLLSMAREYQEAIQRWRGRGRYVLGGWSMGGVIAHQVADLMSRAGNEVALVFTIDSYPPAPTPDTDDAHLMSWFMRDAGVVDVAGAEELGRELRALPLEERVQALWQAAQRMKFAPGLERSRFLRLWETFEANARALASHPPPVIESPMLAIDASRSEEGNRPGATRWDELTSGEVYKVQLDADHYSIVQAPRASEVAEHVSQTLAKIGSGSTGSSKAS